MQTCHNVILKCYFKFTTHYNLYIPELHFVEDEADLFIKVIVVTFSAPLAFNSTATTGMLLYICCLQLIWPQAFAYKDAESSRMFRHYDIFIATSKASSQFSNLLTNQHANHIALECFKVRLQGYNGTTITRGRQTL